jgi:hypothetical protein
MINLHKEDFGSELHIIFKYLQYIIKAFIITFYRLIHIHGDINIIGMTS